GSIVRHGPHASLRREGGTRGRPQRLSGVRHPGGRRQPGEQGEELLGSRQPLPATLGGGGRLGPFHRRGRGSLRPLQAGIAFGEPVTGGEETRSIGRAHGKISRLCFDLSCVAPTEQRLPRRAAMPSSGLKRAGSSPCPTTVSVTPPFLSTVTRPLVAPS